MTATVDTTENRSKKTRKKRKTTDATIFFYISMRKGQKQRGKGRRRRISASREII